MGKEYWRQDLIACEVKITQEKILETKTRGGKYPRQKMLYPAHCQNVWKNYSNITLKYESKPG